MENELKNLLAKYESNYHAVDWENMAIPLVGELKKVAAISIPAVK